MSFRCGLKTRVVAAENGNGLRRIKPPEMAPVALTRIAKLGPGPSRENSGIVKSRQHPDLFWIENDSGDEPRIYPIHRDGKNYSDTRYADEQGILIGGAINVDWEDIAVNDAGEVLVADLGNNENDRQDLVIYVLSEPAPTAGRTTFRKKLFVRYPDQHEFPASRDQRNFDCEAVFTVDDKIYLLSKNRSNTLTTMYRLDDEQSEEVNTLTKLGSFDVHGQAVGADCMPDGKRLVVLTYTGVWLFTRDSLAEDFFTAAVRWAPLGPQEAEAICFADDDTLLIANEATAELFELPLSSLVPVE